MNPPTLGWACYREPFFPWQIMCGFQLKNTEISKTNVFQRVFQCPRGMLQYAVKYGIFGPWPIQADFVGPTENVWKACGKLGKARGKQT